ncbi:TatD family hydrolase [Thalassomonas viridans]|uniref:TatD family hydrolase n=1 Tax=Thalassomonas viridans TaxID=137584 RepID=A0AAE9Z5F2_9GAMM|nr:TatD family hydrolase [Thalassomonas viridans]WDE05477.1 TatD family hydrolase [Thalassomonas viridans]
MIDIGVNLTNNRFDKDRNDVLSRAKAAGVQAMLITGTNIVESREAVALCQQEPGFLYSTAGVHPHDADGVSSDYLDILSELSQQPCVRAIGECGLDFNRNFSAPEQQKRVFSEQIALAARLDKPLFLHQRDAFDTWFELLSPYLGRIPALVAHCFTGSREELLTCLDAGMYVGITGWLCDERRGQELRDIVKLIPLQQLMIETDAPYLLPRNIRPKPKSSRNEPAYLPVIVDMLAQLTGYSRQEIIAHTRENTAKVFALTAQGAD